MARAIAFSLPAERNATAPPERRGLRRDYVRLLVLDRETGSVEHARFFEFGRFLRPGDVLVLNNSRTIPAALWGRRNGGATLEVRLHRRLGTSTWEALLLAPALPAAPGAGEASGAEAGAAGEIMLPADLAAGERLGFAGGLSAEVTAQPAQAPLRVLRFSACNRALTETFYRLGQPVRYEYVARPWGLEYYQTVYGSRPGSVEMPSAGRAFTWELLLRLQRQGVHLAYLTLHAGLGYYGDDRYAKQPGAAPEPFEIPAATAALVRATRAEGRRVIAVGTTVVRALEHATLAGELSGWTSLYVGPGHRLQAVDGLLTGLHEPEASHLDMLAAFVAPDRLHRAYAEAIALGYLWHEFGDMNLILPGGGAR